MVNGSTSASLDTLILLTISDFVNYESKSSCVSPPYFQVRITRVGELWDGEKTAGKRCKYGRLRPSCSRIHVEKNDDKSRRGMIFQQPQKQDFSARHSLHFPIVVTNASILSQGVIRAT